MDVVKRFCADQSVLALPELPQGDGAANEQIIRDWAVSVADELHVTGDDEVGLDSYSKLAVFLGSALWAMHKERGVTEGAHIDMVYSQKNFTCSTYTDGVGRRWISYKGGFQAEDAVWETLNIQVLHDVLGEAFHQYYQAAVVGRKGNKTCAACSATGDGVMVGFADRWSGKLGG
ncbi:hypothetical protein PG993_004538 [Apiospora rasikravindrae]|uniref:Uncharacterized protein n=1 Tax=Apiospora rasikravindrae TaxID=990691 RepID=A0ABR1TD05_9PEZI